MLPHLLLAASIAFSTNFEAGNIGKVEHLGDNHLQINVAGEEDQDGRNHQPSWFYVRLDGVAGRELTIDIGGLEGEYNYRKHDGSGHRNTLPSYSHDNEKWQPVDSSEWLENPSRIRIKLRPEADRVWIARQPPYTVSRLEKLLGEFQAHPALSRSVAGKTVAGRPLHLLTVTDPGTPDANKKVIWLMLRQHSWESGTSWVGEGALRFLLSNDANAQSLRRDRIFKIFPMADPDGVARGGVRFNKFGFDINRNWDTAEPSRMPEISAMRAAIREWLDAGRRIDLFLTVHNTESVDYIEGPVTPGGAPMRWLPASIHEALSARTHFHSPRGPRDSLAEVPAKGRQTVNQWLYLERKIPAFLMELMVDRNPKIGRPPLVSDRLEFGGELAQILAEAAR